MKLNFGLLGIALAQSGDYSDERHDYSYDYNLGNSHYSGFGGDQSYSFNSFGGKAFGTGTQHTQATRLSCWNSNALRDMNMDGRFFDHTSDPYHHYNHQYGFENAYYHQGVGNGAQPIGEFGDFGHNVDPDHQIDVTDPQHSVMAVDPQKWGYQVTNPDAKFHYGHHVENDDLATNENRPHNYQISTNPTSFDGVIDDWRYSLRHAGCLYEAPDFFYSGDTFNMLRYLTYSYEEHLFATDAVTPGPDVTMVHWVHVFNAHIHIGDFDDYCHSDGSTVNVSTSQHCLNGDPIHQFAVVMANPTYEGLGYINFVATYHDAFDDSSAATEVGHRFRTHYDEAALYENSGFWHLSTTGQNVQTDPNAKSWHLPCDNTDCGTNDWRDASDRPRGLAISSFPHNQLGKDFRFNIRTLHQMGDGFHRATARAPGSGNTAYSYFFYAISEIEILFPQYVSYVNDCWRQRNHNNCQSDMVHQIIVDQSSVQMTSSSPQNRNGDIANGNYQLMAKLTNSDSRCNSPGIANGAFGAQACASWCALHGMTVGGHMEWPITAPGGTNNLCGDTLNIWGIHRTYDELHMRQFGTIQEIWVQLMYAYSVQTDYVNLLGFESPFPNVFFSAPQVKWVEGFCDDSDYGKCTGYTRLQNVPYAGSDVDGDRWEVNADTDGADRGDGFWVDDQNV